MELSNIFGKKNDLSNMLTKKTVRKPRAGHISLYCNLDKLTKTDMEFVEKVLDMCESYGNRSGKYIMEEYRKVYKKDITDSMIRAFIANLGLKIMWHIKHNKTIN